MDWNLKGHDHLGLSDFDEDPNPNMHLGSGGSGSFGFHGNFSVDLKLGHVVNNDDESLDRMKIPSVPKLAYSPSSKRARAVNNGVQTAYCLVDECTSDLSNCREYHRRHKVCEAHSKTPEVTIGGHKQRFCQQCSRFHSLGEFDEGKRSCRKRLDGHNRRRRKPQPEASHQHLGSLLPNYPGTRMFPFSTPDPFTMATLSQPTWPEGFRSDAFASSSSAASRAFREEPKQQQQPQFSLLCGTNLYLSSQTVPEASKFFCDGSSQILGGSGRALSLLSSPSLSSQSLSPSQQQQAPEMMRTSMSLNAPPPPPRRLNNYGGMRMDNNLEELVMVPNGSVVDQGMFQLGPEVATPVETPQTLPFYWDG